MLITIVAMYVGSLSVYWLLNRLQKDHRDRYGVGARMFLSLWSTLIAMMVLTFALFFWNVGTATRHQTFDEPIASISTGTVTGGNFFLGSGSIDQNPVYYFWQVDGKGYTLGSVWAYGSTIIEDATPSTSHVTQTCKVGSKSTFNWIEYKQDCTQILHVPPHTVVKTYDATLPH